MHDSLSRRRFVASALAARAAVPAAVQAAVAEPRTKRKYRFIDRPGLPRLANALKAFPKLPFIGHAAGFWASISGDARIADFGRYPEIPTAVAKGGALDKLMDKFPNLYGDLSELSVAASGPVRLPRSRSAAAVHFRRSPIREPKRK